MAEEQVTSPDQRKPINRKLARIGGLISAAFLLLLLIGNHKGHVEDVFLIVTAGGIVAAILADWLLRKNGLRS